MRYEVGDRVVMKKHLTNKSVRVPGATIGIGRIENNSCYKSFVERDEWIFTDKDIDHKKTFKLKKISQNS